MKIVDAKKSRFWLHSHSIIVIGMSGDEDESGYILLEPRWTTDVPDKPGYETITLEDIAAQFSENRCLTVIVEDPLEGHIYRYNNYGNQEWIEVGTTCGYA